MKIKLLMFLAVAVLAIGQVQAETVPVPNGSFEEAYKPGTAIFADLDGGWTNGVGMTPGASAPMNGAQLALFDDGTSGDRVDIPGWVNSGAPWDVPPYDWTEGSGSIADQGSSPYGDYYFTANGSDWGNAPGGAIESAADLTMIEADMDYTLSIFVNGPVVPVVLDLMANGVVLTPSSSVDPGGPYAWDTVSNTYNAADLVGHLGESLRIRVGWGPDTSGSQSHLDAVSLTKVPEPATMSLLVFGGLALLRRKKS